MKVLDQARAIGRFGGVGAALLSTLVNLMAPAAVAAQDVHHHHPRTPIKHVIVIIGENRSFDHVYATYQSPSGDHVSNLLSKGIVNPDGTPGPKYARSTTLSAVDSIISNAAWKQAIASSSFPCAANTRPRLFWTKAPRGLSSNSARY